MRRTADWAQRVRDLENQARALRRRLAAPAYATVPPEWITTAGLVFDMRARGWLPVTRVNRTTVTVTVTPNGPGPDRIPLHRIGAVANRAR